MRDIFSSRSFPRIALIVGLVIGLTLGLIYTWVINPVELVNTYPALLRSDYRRDWIRLVALSYVADGNLERARERLDGLERENIAEAMESLIEEYAAAGRSADTLRSLAALAKALDVHTPAMLVYSGTPPPTPVPPTVTPSPTLTLTPSPTSTPTNTPTPSPEPTSTPTISASVPVSTPTPVLTGTVPTFTPTPTVTPTLTPTPSPTPPLLERLELIEKELVCQPEQTPHIEVVVNDEEGEGVAGVEVWLTWADGADRAVTGLKPQEGPGYADFNAQRGVTYSLGVGELGLPLVTDLQLEICRPEKDADGDENGGEDGDAFVGSWRLVLGPPSLEPE